MAANSNDKKPLILMVEDEEDTALLNARMLKRQGCDVLLAANAAKARELSQNNKPDLFILDVELPDGNGFALCEEIRLKSDAPVLFLTGRKTPQDKIKGMTTGGDYYLTKPFNMDEFAAITTRLLQRAEETKAKLDRAVREATELTRGPLTLYLPENKATVNGRDAALTPKEFAVLLALARNIGSALSAEELYSIVWNAPAAGDTGALRAHIANIKNKIGTNGTDDFDIVFERGKGYRLVVTYL